MVEGGIAEIPLASDKDRECAVPVIEGVMRAKNDVPIYLHR